MQKKGINAKKNQKCKKKKQKMHVKFENSCKKMHAQFENACINAQNGNLV